MPDPIHPIVVHMPMAIVVLLPLFIVGAMIAIRRGVAPRAAWAAPLVLAALLAGSAFVALKTGEREEDRVEAVVPETALHRHEEAGERFLVLSGVLLLVAGAGLAAGTVGTAARLLTAAGSIIVLAAGVQTGMAGGELVYRHDAGSAYAAPAAAGDRAVTRRDDDDD
jgi:uncharacterized membrane protein